MFVNGFVILFTCVFIYLCVFLITLIYFLYITHGARYLLESTSSIGCIDAEFQQEVHGPKL